MDKEKKREERNLRIQQRLKRNQDSLSKEKIIREKVKSSVRRRRGHGPHTPQEVCEKLETRYPGMRSMLAKGALLKEVGKHYGVSKQQVSNIRARLKGRGVLHHRYIKMIPIDPKPHNTENWRKKIERLYPELLLEIELGIESVEKLAFLYEMAVVKIQAVRDRHFRYPTQLRLDLRSELSFGLVTQLVE
jgi:hypothetical protein